MISFFRAVEATLYCLIFLAAVLFAEALIDYQKIYSTPQQSKLKIVVLLSATFLLTLSVYGSHCHGEIGLLECIYISPGEELMRNIGIALFINTSLFLGGLHQWLYVRRYSGRMAKSRGSSCGFTKRPSNGTSSRSCSL